MSRRSIYINHLNPLGASSFKQRGYLMPLAMFLIIGLGALAASVAHLGAQSASSSFREALSVQAFYVADSAAQRGLHQLFFPAADRAIADAACGAMVDVNVAFNSASMNGCSALLNCSLAVSADNATSIYSVTSEASCGAGELAVERQLLLRAFIDE
ncbi:hypothetical protein [Agaribacterium sp. ZY112]|uniref:hypothetical protein n=1 Tax=Agaribacterium sp. ZY112 TaxID=3233574 RepID=UPI003525EC86